MTPQPTPTRSLLPPDSIPLLAGALVLAAVVLPPPPVLQAQQPGASPGSGAAAGEARDLGAVLDTGWIVQDRNGDAVVDFVDVRIVLPDTPEAEEVAAAAEVAARLGFETSGVDLGLAVFEGEVAGGPLDRPVVVVGDRVGLLEASGVDRSALVGGLAPGQGALVHLPAGERLPRGGIAVVGRDGTGLLAAAGYLSARYPAVWDPDGPEWSAVPGGVRAFLEEREIPLASVTLRRVVVDTERPGVARAEVVVGVAEAGAWEAAVRALSDAETEGSGDEDATPPDPDTASAEGPPPLSSLHTRHLHRLDVRIEGPDGGDVVRLSPPEPWSTPAGSPGSAPGGRAFTLSAIYDVGGLYRDTNRDLVPDVTSARLLVEADVPDTGPGPTRGRGAPESPAAASALSAGVVDLAARIGLETAGARFPIAAVTGDEAPSTDGGLPVVVGTDPWIARHLRDEERLPGWDTAPGVGTVRLVPDAIGGEPLLLLAGADAEGTGAALSWLARRAPGLWSHEKGEYRLEDAETAARRFLQARSAAGQAALALHKLDRWAARLAAGRTMDGADPPVPADAREGAEAGSPGSAPGRQEPGAVPTPRRVTAELAVEEAPDGLAEVARAVVAERLPGADVSVRTFTTGYGVGDTIYDRSFDLGWEVDDARRLLADSVYPRIRAGRPAAVELRVSEPPEIREELEREVRGALEARGADPARATVLPAYKQGYGWIAETVLPRLRELDSPIHRVRISYHTLDESDEIRWQTVAADTRWLQELYPIDAVLGRELGLPDSTVSFHPTRSAEPIYRLTVTGPAGDTLLADTFDPRYVVRPFFDLFPEYERVRVTTGWLTATSGGDTLAHRRVVTDPERFWDVLQTEVYGRIVEYVMDVQDGDPSPAHAPYFDELTVRLRMSEPNRRIGIDEEVISSLEALHEDVYFETLTLFDLIGNRYGVGGLRYPGRILPYIDPTGAGEPAGATVTLTGKERGAPELVVTAEREGAEPERREYALRPLPVPDPPLRGVSVRADGVERLLFEAEVVDSMDRWDDFRERSREASIDRTFLSAELLRGMLGSLRRLHAAGLYGEALSWDRVDRTAILFRLEDDSTWSALDSVPRSPAPLSTERPELLADGWSWDGDRANRMVQWETPIGPAENDSILARLHTFPGFDVYRVAESFLGQPVWAVDVLPPQPARWVGQAKLNALKPTLLLSGRQHANEVSSTSHILRLAELLATDSTYRRHLDEVNVVLHPLANPDGARLAVEMQETNPDFMLHAGYLGALGVDMTAGERSDDPTYPESQARRLLRETWLPDVYVNMHGYPSHEWVQYFAGYSAWVRSRRGGAREWWAPRGWFVPGFRWVDDDEHPEYREAQFALLDTIAASIRAEPDVAAMSDRLYARYRKYGKQDVEGFREHFRNDVLMYLSLRGSDEIGQGVYSPRITYLGITTEAPDETARGDWLELVASAGLAHSSALLRYLATGEYQVEREVEADRDGVTRRVYRVKPVLPPGEAEDDGGGGDPGGGG